MPNAPYRVIVVVDRYFGEKLSRLPPGVPVWIVESDQNAPVAHLLWKERPRESHLTGITTFRDERNLSPEQILIEQLGTIDLHHGPLSADPAYSQIEVIGTVATQPIRAALAELGFDRFSASEGGFLVARLHRR